MSSIRPGSPCPSPLDRQPASGGRSPGDDASLLARVARHDQAAFGALYDRYATLLYSVSLKILGIEVEAEENMLDVFCQVWRTAGTFDVTRGRLETWLLLITRSRALDRLRRLARQERVAAVAEDPALLPVALPDPEAAVLSSERQQAVIRALAGLPEPQRAMLELAFYQGLSHSEIAERTGEPLGTIKTRIRLGLGKLRLALAPVQEVEA